MLEIRPCDFQTARDFVRLNHRHNKPPVGHKFSIACYDGDRLCGVCMVGRPVSRYLDDGLTLEVNRCCTDGTRNACTILYGAATRAANALGYKRIIEAFEKWALATGYDDTMTIDKIDNNKGYSPDNCQWLTKSENSIKMHRERGHRIGKQ